MKHKSYYIFAYLLILIIFPFIQRKLAHGPHLQNLQFNSEVKDKYQFTKKDLRNENVFYFNLFNYFSIDIII